MRDRDGKESGRGRERQTERDTREGGRERHTHKGGEA